MPWSCCECAPGLVAVSKPHDFKNVSSPFGIMDWNELKKHLKKQLPVCNKGWEQTGMVVEIGVKL